MNTITKIAIVAILIALGAIFSLGWYIGKERVKCPEIASKDTIWVYDTTWVTIHDTSYYPLKPDTVIVVDSIPTKIDTAAILQKYFNKYTYEWEQRDSNIIITGNTLISQNHIFKNDIRYRWLQPTSTVVNNIDNSINYSKYLQFGFGVPFKNFNYLQLEANYIFPKGYVGGYWEPELKSFGVKTGVTILKFK